MSDLAILLCQQGHQVTGSDVTFAEHPATRKPHTIHLPEERGWFPHRITKNLDKVIVGRRVHPDNVELKAAQQLGLAIYSYAAYIYDYAEDKQRIVITDSEESKLISALVLHVLTFLRRDFDYVVHTAHQGVKVKLSHAPIIILESDLYPASPIHPLPQSLCYQHNVILLSSADWVHNATYPTYASYVAQIRKLVNATPKGGTLIYHKKDTLLKAIKGHTNMDIKEITYIIHAHQYAHGQAYLSTPQATIPFPYADTASLCAVAGAQQLLRNLAVTETQFYEALKTLPCYADHMQNEAVEHVY